MRYLIIGLFTALLVSCFPASPVRQDPEVANEGRKAELAPAARAQVVGEAPQSVAAAPRFISSTLSGIIFDGVEFDSRNHRLVVADQADGPGSKFTDAAAAARARGGIAAVNAGFFTPEGAPLGLVVSAGKSSGAWNTASSLGSAAWFENPAGRMAIVRREALGRAGAAAMRELIQAGPLLIQNGRAVGGLDSTKTSVRTIVLTDGGTRWWIGRSSPCTLSALGRTLDTGEPAGWPVREALNLDGGRSSDLWISGSVIEGRILRRTPWNRPVRNFLVLVERDAR